MKTGKTTVFVGSVVLMVLLFFGIGPTTALAIDLEGGEKKDPINWAFAVHLGTGIYTASGRAVQVFTLPFSYTFRDVKDYNWGFKVKFPVTLYFPVWNSNTRSITTGHSCRLRTWA
ncbi:MAG: hypothetical protein JRF69_13810 [Deltaproteobacteria bacterium]|nr:hypothetical protein [Deltaproteobacteria bacterium]